MAELKTKVNNADVVAFIKANANSEQQCSDSLALLKLMQDHTGYAPKMWGTSIIGYGVYHYKSTKSKQEGDWPLVGFSPRKKAISLYVYMGAKGQELLLKDLGKFKMGKACIYINKLSDINIDVLKNIMDTTIMYLKEKYGE